jgi:catechol 2,3-dioxygenase-like lactoylglutathione lyase family enzyme
MTLKPAIAFGRAAPGVFVRDIDRACAFYSDVLGFQKTFENGQPVGFVILKNGAAEIHLSLVKDHKPAAANVVHFLVDDVDALYYACVSAGTRIIKSLADKDYGLRSFVLADPDGNRMDVGQRIASPRSIDEDSARSSGDMRIRQRSLQGSAFEDSSLANSTFDKIDLSETRFTGVNFRQARLTNVDLSAVVIEDARIDGLTILGHDVQTLIKAEIARRKSE